ncbi:MAG: Fe-S cluster assembly ATPase SufC [Acidimicrobiia bacterium]
MLEIVDLHVKVAASDKNILNGVSLTVSPGEIHAFMGPNGSGKSTMTHAIMGNEKYEITKGKILLDGVDITSMPTFERARNGLFATMQYPVEIPGVNVNAILSSVYGDVSDAIENISNELILDKDFLDRGVNDEFSGGERKKMETLQLSVSSAKYAILDEIDSGLDVDALKIIATKVMQLVESRNLGVVAITHYDRLLNYLKPTHVHIFAEGKIVKSGSIELAKQLETSGYESFV